MISQTLRNFAGGSNEKLAEIGAIIDGSLKLRLQQMREVKGSADDIVLYDHDDVDNCIAVTMYAIYNFARLRHADKIGATYWMIADEDGQTLVPVDFFTMLDGKVQSIRRNNAILSGDLEFPANTWESDMECLVTFVEHSSKSKIVGQYRTLQAKMEAERGIGEPARSLESFEPTGSHRAVETMKGSSTPLALPCHDTFNPYEDGEFSEAMEAGMEIEQQTKSSPAPTKAKKKSRKSDKTVVDVAYGKHSHGESKSGLPVKVRSKSSRAKSSMTSI